MATIHRLAGRGDPFELLALLDAGADPNDASGETNRTPLMEAAKHDNVVAARLLIQRGAKPDARGARGETPLSEAKTLAMRRLLLDSGADPDFHRWNGVTDMANFAEIGLRDAVELFRSYGADTQAKMRGGRTVQEALEDPEYRWNPFDRMKTPESRQRNAEQVRKHSNDLLITPEQFVSKHRNILIWSYGSDEYDDPRLQAWAARVLELLRSPQLLEVAYRENLEGKELDDALRSLERPRRRAERERLRMERDREFSALHLDGR